MSRLIASALLALALAGPASAQEAHLRGVSAFAEKTTYSRGFETFIERVNAAGKGVIQITYIGGPKAMPPFEVGNALKNGVIDLASSTGAFYTNLMPEADAWKLTQRPMSELRKNGGYDYMAKLYEQKMNAILLARVVDNNPFHLYLNKKIAAPDPILVQISSQVVKVVMQEPGALGLAQLGVINRAHAPEMKLDFPVEQRLSLVSLGEPTPAMQSVINATREIASKVPE